MSRPLPIVHIPRVGEDRANSIPPGDVAELLDLLAARDYRTPPAPDLWTGTLSARTDERQLLTATSMTDTAGLARWSDLHGARGFASLIMAPVRELASTSGLSEGAVRQLIGMGAVVAPRGTPDDPLVDLPADTLRERLGRVRSNASELLGYTPELLAPIPSPGGRTVDGIVLREAARAGFTAVLRPGDSPAADRADRLLELTYRTWRPDESPYAIRDWILGRWRARATTAVRSVAERSRRWLAHLGEAGDG